MFQRLDDREGIAQATRHLGKLALLQGLNSYYQPSALSGAHFTAAGRRYRASLRVREQLHKEGLEQRERIADMKLDFGRLYWLEGRMYELQADATGNEEMLAQARRKYETANKVSREALTLFEEIQSERGIAKAWGNLGNATKEQARSFLRCDSLQAAGEWLNKAQVYYEKSLEIARKIKREDEIAHAAWGLAEVSAMRASHADLHGGVVDAEHLLATALCARVA